MNLYFRRPRYARGWINLTDQDGRIVGRVTPEVANWLKVKGIAMDLTGEDQR